jgi:hypothetical protein
VDSKSKEGVNISGKLELNINKTIENAEERIREDSCSLKLLQKIQEDEKTNINEIEDQKRLETLIDYGMVNRLLNNEVVVSGIGSQVLRDLIK